MYSFLLNNENLKKFGFVKTKKGNYRNKKKKITLYHRVCKSCGVDFIAPKSQRYCSIKCSSKVVNSNNKTNFDVIKKSFESEGYNLLTKSNEYKNQYTKLYFICPNGHKHFITWANWSNKRLNQRCAYCAKNKPLTYEDIKKSFERRGYILLTSSKDFTNTSRTILKYKCDKGHINKIRWNNWYRGNGRYSSCPDCQNRSAIPFSVIRKMFEDEGYQVLTKESEYKNQNSTKIKFICPNGHKHSISVRKWRIGRRCSRCGISKPEREIKKYLNEIGVKYVDNDRKTILNPFTNHYLELDAWIPKMNIAIEMNGKYWHNKPEKKWNDNIKKIICKKKGINLITIWDEEWNNNRKQVEEKLYKELKE